MGCPESSRFRVRGVPGPEGRRRFRSWIRWHPAVRTARPRRDVQRPVPFRRPQRRWWRTPQRRRIPRRWLPRPEPLPIQEPRPWRRQPTTTFPVLPVHVPQPIPLGLPAWAKEIEVRISIRVNEMFALRQTRKNVEPMLGTQT